MLPRRVRSIRFNVRGREVWKISRPKDKGVKKDIFLPEKCSPIRRRPAAAEKISEIREPPTAMVAVTEIFFERKI